MQPSRQGQPRDLRGALCSFAAAGVLSIAGCGDGSGDAAKSGRPSAPPAPGASQAEAADSTSPTGLRDWDAELAETFQVAALDQLKEILKRLGAGDGADDPALASLVVDPAECVEGSLRPADRHGSLDFDEDGIQVRRWPGPDSPTQSLPLSAAYRELSDPWPPDSARPRIKVKHFGVTPDDGVPAQVVTRTNFYAFAEGADSSVQQSAEWRCRWLRAASPEDPPRLLSIRLVELEEVRAEHGGRGRFLADVTHPLLGGLPAFADSLSRDANYWITRLPLVKHRFQHGISIADVDGDGLEDIYLCQPERLPNLLLMRQPDGGVREAAAELGLDFLDNTTSVIFADFDNDGDQDLAAAFRSPFDLFENVGGTFEQRFSLPHLGQIFSLAAADFDRDGLLDLYICRYQKLDELGRAPSAIPLHDARNGGANVLLKNLGGWQFADVTGACGLGENNDRWSTAASWEDFDRDGDLDLYVSNDYGRNNLYRCDLASDGAVKFTDIAGLVGVEDMTTSMGVSWGDPNRDGWPDAYVSNMYSSAGRRVTFQKNFKRNIPGSDPTHVHTWQNASMGNSLFQGNGGDQTFLHTSAQARIQNGQWAWGSAFADINHDGWEDLLVANGFITGPSEEQDL